MTALSYIRARYKGNPNMLNIAKVNRARALRWHPHGIESWSMSDWATALGGEVGEICEVVELYLIAQYPLHLRAPGAVFVEELAGEIGDSYCYLDLFAQACDLDLVTCMEAPAAQWLTGKHYSGIGIAVSVAAECGKLQDIVKKLNRVRDGLAGNRKTEEELRADLRMRVGLLGNKLVILAEHFNLEFVLCVRDKFNKVSERMSLPERL